MKSITTGHLTGIGFDGEQAFAAWTLDPARISRLLMMLLDDRRSDREVVIDASTWADQVKLIVLRVAPRQPGRAAVVATSMDDVQVEVTLRWPGETGPDMTRMLPPGKMQHIELPRPGAGAGARVGANVGGATSAGPVDLGARRQDVQMLELRVAGFVRQMSFPVSDVAARPPGVFFTLRPSLTLIDAQTGRQRGLRPDRATNVQLRKIAGRWEVFVECLRPTPVAAEGREAIMLFFGGEPAQVILAVPERGPHRFFHGTGDPMLEVHRDDGDGVTGSKLDRAPGSLLAACNQRFPDAETR